MNAEEEQFELISADVDFVHLKAGMRQRTQTGPSKVLIGAECKAETMQNAGLSDCAKGPRPVLKKQLKELALYLKQDGLILLGAIG